MNKLLLTALLAGCVTTVPAQVFIKNLPNGDPYPGYFRSKNVDQKQAVHKTTARRAEAVTTLPDHWDNSKQKYFPPIFSQGAYGSCGVSSHVGYMMTSEMNAYNNTDASLPENQLTPMFEYPFTYHGPGKDEMALYVGFPTADIYGGRYESSIYGGSEYDKPDWGWVQGYATFYNAMKHRISSTASFPQSVETKEGQVALKRYLYNHNGDPAYGGRGGVVCMGVGIARSQTGDIPQSGTNDANGFTGKKYMVHWNLDGGDHAMTIIGYDDRVQFDLDGNGIVGEAKNTLGQDENGAWIIANTWGHWANKGFVYCPYAMGGGVSKEVKTSTGVKAYKPQWYWIPYMYIYRGGYTPKRTMKVTMEYDHRSEISVQVGIASDTTATVPEKTFQFSYINYTGDGTNTDPATPLLGKWADGKVHNEPMEFGVDLTDLTDEFDSRKPLKYFLVVNSKNTAKGTGKILSASVIDYEFDPEGIETVFANHDVTIQNGGKQTLVSEVINGEPLNAPLNAELDASSLKWQAPQGSALKPVKYYVYKDGEKVTETTSTSYAATDLSGVWTVRAVYNLNGKEYLSAASNEASSSSIMSADQAYDSKVIKLSSGSFWVPDVVASAHNAYTVEFWFKPTNLHNWGDYLFYDQWNKYRVHTSQDGSISAGWGNDNNNRINTSTGVLQNGKWAHIAIVVDGNKQAIYVNGVKKAEGTSSNNSGFPEYWNGRLYFGNGGTLNGNMDELRLWSCARTEQEIKDNYKVPIVSPKSVPSLEAYFKMDTYKNGTTTFIKDLANGHDAQVERNVTSTTLANGEQTLEKGVGQATAAIIAPKSAVAGQPVALKAQASLGATRFSWTADGGTPAQSDIVNPSFVFKSAGSHKVTLKVTDISGSTATAEATVEVITLTPTADFTISADDVEARGRISFISLNKAPGCTYHWDMPGADQTTSTLVNASASYKEIGMKTVTLTVTDPDGKTYKVSKSFNVKLTAPIAGAKITPNVVKKGESVQLDDNSAYGPSDGYWSFVSNNSYLGCEGLHGSVTPTKSGIYTLNYTATNALGSNTVTIPRALIVCNEDSKTGLTFYKGEGQTLSLTVPSGITNAWTLDFWLKPDELTDNGIGLVASKGDKSLKITTDHTGKLQVAAGTTTGSLDNYFVAGEWHHYAFAASGKNIYCYRDGEKVGTVTGQSSYADYFGTLTLGGTLHSFKGSIDEFRLWGSTIGQSTLGNYAVKPVNVNSVQSSYKLKVYYDFNQTVTGSTTVTDLTTNKANATLAGFENTVDYFKPSLGVFGLNFESVQAEKIVGTEIAQSKFSVTETSDAESDKEKTPGSNVLDGSTTTFWHSQWSTAVEFPHSITFHRNVCDTIRTIKIMYATDKNHNTAAYRSGNITVQQSADGTNWTYIDKNHILFNMATQNAVLLKPATEPYVRIVFNTSLDNSKFLCVSEIKFYGTAFDPTGVESVTTNVRENDHAIYDLSGRRLDRISHPGIYIIGGKKVVVK